MDVRATGGKQRTTGLGSAGDPTGMNPAQYALRLCMTRFCRTPVPTLGLVCILGNTVTFSVSEA